MFAFSDSKLACLHTRYSIRLVMCSTRVRVTTKELKDLKKPAKMAGLFQKICFDLTCVCLNTQLDFSASASRLTFHDIYHCVI